MRQINKKTLESLIKAGAFDSTGYTRKHLHDADGRAASTPRYEAQQDVDAGQVSMFDMFAAEDHGFTRGASSPNGDEWDKKMKLAFEKEMLGIYVSDHPLREIADVGPPGRRLLARRHRRAHRRHDRLVRRHPRDGGRASPPRRAR